MLASPTRGSHAMPAPGASRRLLLSLLLAFAFASFLYISVARRDGGAAVPRAYADTPVHPVAVAPETLHGDAIMPKLGNETLKAELGRAAWKLFHTTMARFPDTPTPDEQTALSSYIHLFARLYPCGECAGHFRQILARYPPQVGTRSAAAVWACHVHNKVNEDLKKPLFDCANIGDFYDCGCAGGEDEGKKKEVSRTAGGLVRPTSQAPSPPPLRLEREGHMNGG